MARPSLIDHAKAAFLHTEMQWDQKTLANHFKASQGAVSKALDRAKKEGLLRVFEGKVLMRDKLGEQKLNEFRAEFLEMDEPLREQLAQQAGDKKDRLRSVRVFSSGGKGTERAEYHLRLEEFGTKAAPYLAQLLPRMKFVGLSWGKTISALNNGLIAYPHTYGNPTVFPTCAELYQGPAIGDSASELAKSLRKFFRSLQLEDEQPADEHDERNLFLTGFAHCIPTSIHKQRGKEIIRKYAAEFLGHKAILAKGGLVEKMDAWITGVGTADTVDEATSDDPWLEERIKASGLSRADFSKATIGDLGGIYLPRSNVKGKRKKDFEQIIEPWMCVRFEHAAQCAAKTDDKESVGVVVAAIGHRKCDIVHACVQRGVVNELIVDDDLADALRSKDPEPQDSSAGRKKAKRKARGKH